MSDEIAKGVVPQRSISSNGDSPFLEDTSGEETGFLNQICVYFRDFLETDFRRQRTPKRSISLKDQRDNLTGIAVAKYPELMTDLWAELEKTLTVARFSFTVRRGKYRARLHRHLLEIIEKHVQALKEEELLKLADRVKAMARELYSMLENDPERYRDTVVHALRNDLVRTAVAPLLEKLEIFFANQGADAFEAVYDIENELGARLVSDVEEAIGSALATAIVENRFDECDTVIADVVAPETTRRRLTGYFEIFHTADFFQDLHELRSTLKLRENFETYLYVGEIRHNRVAYPLFYLPISVTLEDRLFHVTADPHIYINKKALHYAAQETARELGRPTPLLVDDRVVYLQEGQSYVAVMQHLLDKWCADLALKPPIDLSERRDQQSQRSQMAITNALHFAAFDKSDEALLNDYEEIMTVMASNAETAEDFKEIVMGFLSKDPVSVTAAVERAWSETPIQDRLVFQSPVPLNEEQRKIIAALHHKDTRFIAVEGPPGTGKSHTISAIVFEAILKGQNVLVLSDKTEALDVVESKLTDVLNSVRLGEAFQNPILRLGRSGSSYGRILATQSIEAIRAHHKAMASDEERLTTRVRQDEERLASTIRATAEQGAKIDLQKTVAFHRHEARVQDIIPDPEDVVSDETKREALNAVHDLAVLLTSDNGAILRILRAALQRTTLEDLEAFLTLQPAYARVWPFESSGTRAMRFFSSFRVEHLQKLHAVIAAYQSVRWPVFGFLFTRGRGRAIDARLGSELAPVNALDAHKHLPTLRQAHAAFSNISAQLSQDGIAQSHHVLAFQQAIEDMPPITDHVDSFLQKIAIIRNALEQRPALKTEIGLDPDALADWTPQGASAASKRLQEVLAFAGEYEEQRRSFHAIPEFDYAGDMTRLESLHAQRLAYIIDGRVIEFADEHRNLSRSIRDIIRKRQKFPRENFEALKKAFPCMIAGIRNYAEYVPLVKQLFDVIIIDEASQVSIAQAFPAFVRAKKLVVLGDRKQFSNVKTATASKETNNQYINAIIEDFRRTQAPSIDTLNRLQLFNIKSSVLEFVERIANYQAMLRKHFRGYPELISFSTRTFYNNQLQAVKIRGRPIDQVIRFTPVEHDGRAEIGKNTNTPEYEAILSELRRLSALDDPPSVGIITPFNEQQAFIVQNIATLPDAERMQTALNLKVMTFDSCQGEERDIIIYSLVATPLQDKLNYIFPRSLDEADEVDHILRLQRLNVGFSRAKECLHIFHSQALEQFQGAIARALAHYWSELETARKRPAANDTDKASPMETRVLAWLNQTRFVQRLGPYLEIDTQFELGAYLRQLDPTYRHPDYRVDFLLKVNTPSRTVSIIIEYDGFKEHFTNLADVDASNYREYYRPEDVERQKVLEGYGYRFLRINRFNIGRDPVRTLGERLTRLAEDALDEARPHEIVEEVKGKADKIAAGEMKTCSTCGELKSIDQFKDPSLKRGVGRKCRDCKAMHKTPRKSSTHKN
jgi:very-short-patch-repair endonuclease